MLHAEEILNTLPKWKWLPSDAWPNPMYIFESESQGITFGTDVFEYELRTGTRPAAIAIIAFGDAKHLVTGETYKSTTVCVVTHDREETIIVLDNGERLSSSEAKGETADLMRQALGIK